MKKKSIFLAVCYFLLFSASLLSQTKKALEQQREAYKKEIRQINNLLFKEQQKEQNVLELLEDLNKKIAVRQRLINTIKSESRLLQNTITKNQKEIAKLTKELEALKADYAAMIYKSYKSKSQQSRLLFLLSSDNFYQAYKRLEYMKQYTSFRQRQGIAIEKTAQLIVAKNDSLAVLKKDKSQLLKSNIAAQKDIESDKKQQEILIAKIKKKEKKYKRDIRNKVIADRKVAAKIDKLIKAEIAKANKKSRKNATIKPKAIKKNEFYLSPEAKDLALRFEQNKGQLPWPVSEGIITRKFGVQPHPTFPGITLNSTGIHFTTRKGNIAKAVFNGEVFNVLKTTGGKKNIFIRHGNYITSYNNIEMAAVKTGDVVKTGDNLGMIFTNKVSGKTTLIFVLYKNTIKLNPSLWLLRR